MTEISKLKVYVDPCIDETKLVVQRRGRVKLLWPEYAYYCNEMGEAVDSSQLADPKFDPWLDIFVQRTYNDRFDFNKAYWFLYHPSSRRLIKRSMYGDYQGLKTEFKIGSNFHKIFEEKIAGIEFKISPYIFFRLASPWWGHICSLYSSHKSPDNIKHCQQIRETSKTKF